MGTGHSPSCFARYPSASDLYLRFWNQDSGFSISQFPNSKISQFNYFLATFFLPATVLRLPFLVRLLVLVR